MRDIHQITVVVAEADPIHRMINSIPNLPHIVTSLVVPDIFHRVQFHEEMIQFMISIILYAYGKKSVDKKLSLLASITVNPLNH